jgi:hypothetical protein
MGFAGGGKTRLRYLHPKQGFFSHFFTIPVYICKQVWYDYINHKGGHKKKELVNQYVMTN